MKYSFWLRRNSVKIQSPRIIPFIEFKRVESRRFVFGQNLIYNLLQLESTEIRKFCSEKGFEYLLVNDEIRIISRYDCWRIITREGKLALFHRNRRRIPSCESCIDGFHQQRVYSETIMGYLKIIDGHDTYKKSKLPRIDERIWLKKEVKEELIKKYGEKFSLSKLKKQRVKGTKKYNREKKKLARKKRRANISRVISILDEINIEIP